MYVPLFYSYFETLSLFSIYLFWTQFLSKGSIIIKFISYKISIIIGIELWKWVLIDISCAGGSLHNFVMMFLLFLCLFKYTSQVFCLIPFLYQYFLWRFHSMVKGEESTSIRAETHLREVKNPEGHTWFASLPNVWDFSISSSWDHHLQGSWKRNCLSSTASCLLRLLTRNL